MASAGLLLFVLAGFFSVVGSRDSVAAPSRSTDSAPPSVTFLAQTEPPPGSDLAEEEEEDWEEEAGDTLSFPPGFTVPPPAAAGTDTTGAATADSTARAPMVPAGPALGDTMRYVPGASPANPTPKGPPPGQPAPEPRKGIFGLHPAAIAFGLVLAHYFIVKSATD